MEMHFDLKEERTEVSACGLLQARSCRLFEGVSTKCMDALLNASKVELFMPKVPRCNTVSPWASLSKQLCRKP